MHVLRVPNVNHALPEGLEFLAHRGIETGSRNGTVLRSVEPVTTVYLNPTERVLFSAVRDANPFFHLYECIWMMAGKNDVASVAKFAKQMEAFSDDGFILWGAYGYRWRQHFGYDQLVLIDQELRSNRTSRRCVLSMWDAAEGPEGADGDSDLRIALRGGKDVPCNTHIYFDVVLGELNMTVCNRSNDVVWGAYGANAVHMSFLQEVMAASVGLPVGVYYQVSNNYHVYADRPDVVKLRKATWTQLCEDRYSSGATQRPIHIQPKPFSLVDFTGQCEDYVDAKITQEGTFLRDVVEPLMTAHDAHKAGDYKSAVDWASRCAALDWKWAALGWLQRRQEAKSRNN